MLTPQDLQEVYFEKARFGGYVMQSVDDFLEPLINDYLALYKENAVLKSKMRLLVERLEEYRGKEAELKKSIEDTQKTCDEMIAKAERRCADMLSSAESDAAVRSRDMDNAVLSEQERLNRAKAATQAFIASVEAELAHQTAVLEALKGLDLTQETAKPAPQKKAYDFESEADEPKLPPEPQPVPELPANEDDIALEIEHSVEKIMENVPTPPEELAKTKVMPAIDFGREDKFADLQFGRNYNPNN